MTGNASAREPVLLQCSVAGNASALPGGFEASFCRMLADSLARDLKLDLAGAAEGGHAVSVTLRVKDAYGASAEIRSGRMEGGTLRATATTTTSVTSHDRELTPLAANMLVRPIAMQIGLGDRLP